MLTAPQYFINEGRQRLEDLRAAGVLARRRKIQGQFGILFPQMDLELASVVLEVPFKPQAARQLTRNAWFLPVDRDELKRRQAQRRVTKERHATRLEYMKLCHNRPAVELQDIKQQLPVLNQKLDQLLKSVTLVARQIDHLRARHAAVVHVLATRGTPRWIAEEFDRLRALPDVEDVKVNLRERKLIVTTAMLYGEEFRSIGVTRYCELGKFEIHVYADGGETPFRLYNRTHRRETTDAPHVNNGYPDCLGEVLSKALAIHLGRSEYSVIITMLIQYLTRDARGGFQARGWNREVPVEVARPHLAHQGRPSLGGENGS